MKVQGIAWRVAALMVALTASARAQQLDIVRAGVQTQRHSTGPIPGPAEDRSKGPHDPLTVTLASAVVPGSGQLLLGQRRAVPYMVLEAAGLAVYVSKSRDGQRQRERYRDIARNVARAGLSATGPDGDWDYYERMEKFVASGEFDRIPGGAIDPELEEETYNGSVWLLARQTFWRDPAIPPDPASTEFAAALRFYVERAAGTEMRWSWAGQANAFSKFRSGIDASNSAFRSAGHAASLVIANHFLSAVDAYVSVRARVRRGPGGATALTASLPIRY